MQQYRRTVEAIQEVIYASAKVTREEMLPLADEYAQACQEVNQRLRSVGDLLRQGLRTSALHKADVEPNLLDVVTLLDFPELPQWVDLTRQLRIPRAPAIQIEIAGDLNDAYDEEKPLEELLRKQRLLAIARAPMVARVTVLRQIAKRDYKNPVWREDLKAYEQVRLGEIRTEIDLLCDAEDVRGAVKLQSELKESPWVAPPSAQLLDYVNYRVGEAVAEISRRRLAALADQMEEAMEGLDLAQADNLVSSWQQLAAHAKPAGNDPSLLKAQRVAAWVENEKNAQIEREEQEFQRAELEKRLEHFKVALRGKMPQETLMARREELRRQGVSLPKYLEGQYAKRLKQFQRAHTVRLLCFLSGVVAAILIVVALIWYFASKFS
jgi:hypothetical protein